MTKTTLWDFFPEQLNRTRFGSTKHFLRSFTFFIFSIPCIHCINEHKLQFGEATVQRSSNIPLVVFCILMWFCSKLVTFEHQKHPANYATQSEK